MPVYFEDVHVGDAMPGLTAGPITETQLVRYAGASGDFNPIHTVPCLAEAAGLDGVIAHGMLAMGLVGRAITAWVGVATLRRFEVRFTGMARPGQIITVTGQVIEKLDVNGEHHIRCEVAAADQEGQPKVQGSFVAVLPIRDK